MPSRATAFDDPSQRSIPDAQPEAQDAMPRGSECGDLEAAAHAAFYAALNDLQVAQCKVAANCGSAVFYSGTDACWDSCIGIYGSAEYAKALKDVADNVCAKFRSMDCAFLLIPCPPLPPTGKPPPVWTCTNGKCVAE
jgi:hypothetical protein